MVLPLSNDTDVENRHIPPSLPTMISALPSLSMSSIVGEESTFDGLLCISQAIPVDFHDFSLGRRIMILECLRPHAQVLED